MSVLGLLCIVGFYVQGACAFVKMIASVCSIIYFITVYLYINVYTEGKFDYSLIIAIHMNKIEVSLCDFKCTVFHQLHMKVYAVLT